MNGDTSKAPRSLQDSFISLDRTLKEVQDLIGRITSINHVLIGDAPNLVGDFPDRPRNSLFDYADSLSRDFEERVHSLSAAVNYLETRLELTAPTSLVNSASAPTPAPVPEWQVISPDDLREILDRVKMQPQKLKPKPARRAPPPPKTKRPRR